MSDKIGSFYEEDIREWEKLPLVARVLTSSHFGAWLYFRDKKKDSRIKNDTIRDFIQVFTSQTKLRQMTKQECIDKMWQIAEQLEDKNNV